STSALGAGCGGGTVAYQGSGVAATATFMSAGTYNLRLCATDGAGNTSAGRTGTLVVSAVPTTRGAVLTGSGVTAQAGNTSGGVAYDDACPAGQVLTGFGGSLSSAIGYHRQI